jgi:hypothetical protein
MLNFSLETNSNFTGINSLGFLRCALSENEGLTDIQNHRINQVFKGLLKNDILADVKYGGYSIPLEKANTFLREVVSAKSALSQEGIVLRTHYLLLYQILTQLKEKGMITQEEEAQFFSGLREEKGS